MTAVFLMCFLVLVGILAGCARQQEFAEDAADIEPAAEDLTQQVNGFTLSSFSDDGTSGWRLEGASADIKGDKIDLKGVRIKSRADENTLTMNAKKGVIEKAAQKGVFSDDVVLAYDDGTTLRTDRVDWFFKKETAETDSEVFVDTGSLKAKAQGARLEKDLNEIRLEKNVSMSTDSGTEISCTGALVMDYKKNKAIFNDNVSIDNQKGKMTGRRMVVFFDAGKKKVKRVEASGSVCLIRGNSISTSDKAVYFAEEGRAVLTGNPRVWIDSQQAEQFRQAAAKE